MGATAPAAAVPLATPSRPAEVRTPGEAGVLGRFFLLSYLLLLLNATQFLFQGRPAGILAACWCGAVLLTYGFLYLAPSMLLAFAAHGLLGRGPAARLLARLRVPAWLPARATAVVLASATQAFVFADARIHDFFGFHVNGYVVGLLTTKGGVESMGADESMTWTVLGLGILIPGIETGILLAAAWWKALATRWEAFARPRRMALAGLLLLLLAAGERIAYGLSDVHDYRPILRSASVFPLYAPVRFKKFARSLGIEGAGGKELPDLRPGSGPLAYPRAPLVAAPDAPRWNVVWLVAESLRFDMLDPEIMPETCAFAARAADFREHFSSGIETRMGVFGMFYGLTGPYWLPFKDDRRPPVLMDFLRERGYQMEAFTSAKFTFPEFDCTVFQGFPPERLHEGDPAPARGWQNDRKNVGLLLDGIDRRDRARPFFGFLFFESAHARYYFPEESVIRRPYPTDKEMNYATLNPERDHALIKNRYVNACHHLDSQFGRVIRGIEERGLLDSTILIVTGDHGEEFMERGRWGHHSGFNRFQAQTPMVIHVPGRAPERVTRMTSHLDLPATVLTLLGVTTPPADYSLGGDMFGEPGRTEAVICTHDTLATRDARGTLVSPMGRAGFVRPDFFGPDDVELPEDAEKAAIRESGDRIRRVLEGLSRFRRK